MVHHLGPGDHRVHHLERYGTRPDRPDMDRELELDNPRHIDEGLKVNNIYIGRTTLHVLNQIIQSLKTSVSDPENNDWASAAVIQEISTLQRNSSFCTALDTL